MQQYIKICGKRACINDDIEAFIYFEIKIKQGQLQCTDNLLPYKFSSNIWRKKKKHSFITLIVYCT